MLHHYIRIAFRNLLRHKLYTAINLAGLTVALASALIVALYVKHEQSYDSHFSKAERIYRMGSNIQVDEGSTFSIAGTFVPLGPALEQDFPDIERAVRLWPSGGTFRIGDERYQDVFYWADADVFEMFDTEVLYGDLETALVRPNTFVITDQVAERYFGTADAVGQTMILDQDRVVEVTAVVKSWPLNSHVLIPIFGSMETARDIRGDAAMESWNNIGINRTYILLRPSVSAQSIENGLPDFLSRWTTSDSLDKSWLDMMPVSDIYLAPRRVDEFPPKGSQARVMIAIFVAALLLIVSVFNFVILTLARAEERFVEMGLRKMHGARQRDVVVQVIGESCTLAVVAYAIAVIIVEAMLPTVAAWLDSGLILSAASLPIPYRGLGMAFPDSVLGNTAFVIAGLAFAVALGVLSGLVPAIRIARTRSASLLGRARSSLSARSRIGFAMVLAQFAASIALVVVGMTVSDQIQHLREVDLGFDKENLIIIGESGQGRSLAAHAVFKQVLSGIPGVISISRSTHAPTLGASRSGYDWQGGTGETEIIAWDNGVDADYVSTMGMEIIAGTDFLPGMTPTTERDADGTIVSDQTFVLVTETFTKKLGLADPADAVGTELRFSESSADVRRRIIGVVEPVEFSSGFTESQADIFFLKDVERWNETNAWHGRASKLIVRIDGTNVLATLAEIDSKWSEVEPDFAIRRWFLDERFENLYRQSERQSDLFRVGITVAVLISVMGLFGLAAFSVQRRTKEVGVRKANGATTPQLIRLMTWDLTKPVLWANVVAWPVAYITANRWLESFALRTDVSPSPYLWAGAAGLFIAWTVVAVHVTRVARTHPTQALRYE